MTPTSRNPVDLNQVIMEARKLLIQAPVGNETEMCGSSIMHEEQYTGREIGHVVFQESFVIPPCKPV
jgi:hypothetical protein